MMRELDLTHLDVVHHEHRDPVCRKPRAVASKQMLVRVAALIEQDRNRFRGAAREVQVGGEEDARNGLEHEVFDRVGRVVLPVRHRCSWWTIGPRQIVPEHALECGPGLLLPLLPLLEGRDPAEELIVAPPDHDLEVRLQ